MATKKGIEDLYGFHIELLDHFHAKKVKEFYETANGGPLLDADINENPSPYAFINTQDSGEDIRFYGFDCDGYFTNRCADALPVKTLEEAILIWEGPVNFFYDEPIQMLVFDNQFDVKKKDWVFAEYEGLYVTRNGVWANAEPIFPKKTKITKAEFYEKFGFSIDDIEIV